MCRPLTPPHHHRWCRGCRALESSPGRSTFPRCTAHTMCRGPAHSWTACRCPPDTWCRAHTDQTRRSGSSRSCTHRWRRWSLCRVSPCGVDPCIVCTEHICLCDSGILRKFHLKEEGRTWLLPPSSRWCSHQLVSSITQKLPGRLPPNLVEGWDTAKKDPIKFWRGID